MKVCPICKAQCFEDMDTCYGCMYHFDSHERNGKQPLQELFVTEREKATFEPLEMSHTLSFDQCCTGEFQAQYQLVISLKPLKGQEQGGTKRRGIKLS